MNSTNPGFNRLLSFQSQCYDIDDAPIQVKNGRAIPLEGCGGHLTARLHHKLGITPKHIASLTEECYESLYLEKRFEGITEKLCSDKPVTGRSACHMLDSVITHLTQQMETQMQLTGNRNIGLSVRQQVREVVHFDALAGFGVAVTEATVQKFRNALYQQLEQRYFPDSEQQQFPSDNDVRTVWQSIAQHIREGHERVHSRTDLTALDKCFIIRSALDAETVVNPGMIDAMCDSFHVARIFTTICLDSKADARRVATTLSDLQQVFDQAIYCPGGLGKPLPSIADRDTDTIISLSLKAALQSSMAENTTKTADNITSGDTWFADLLEVTEKMSFITSLQDSVDGAVLGYGSTPDDGWTLNFVRKNQRTSQEKPRPVKNDIRTSIQEVIDAYSYVKVATIVFETLLATHEITIPK